MPARLAGKTARFIPFKAYHNNRNYYLYQMSRQYRILGIIISLAIGLAVVPIRMTGDDVQSGGLFLAARTFRYTFTAAVLAFLFHLWLSRRFSFFPDKWRYLDYLIKIIVVGIAICMASILLDVIFRTLITNPSYTIAKEDLKWFLIISRSLLVSAVQFFIVFYLQLLSESERRKLEIEKLKQAQLEANLSNLKEQMNPHFLFNTLNTLSAITQDKQVKEYVAEIASVYRYMLVHNKLNLVSLQSELNFIRSYLYIIKIRMGGSIIIDINVDEHLMQTKMPPLTLQLLLENAIKHNVASANNPLRIEVYNDADHLVIGNGFSPKKAQHSSTGVGLNNLMDRYQLLFSHNIVIEKNKTMFIVRLPIIYS